MTTIVLSAPALAALFPEGSEARVSLANSAADKVAEEINRKARRLAEAAEKQSVDSVVNGILRRVENDLSQKWSMSQAVRFAIAEHVREATTAAITTHVREKVDAAVAAVTGRFDEALRKKQVEIDAMEAAMRDRLNAWIKAEARSAFMSVVADVRAATGGT